MWIGVDGCPAGWLMVARADRAGPVEARIFPSFADVVAWAPEGAAIAVDMPIGLPDVVTPESAAREAEARAVIGARQSSIFAVPSRRTLAATEFREACALNRDAHHAGKCLSKQMFHLLPKVREVDAVARAASGRRVVEAHPEVAFWVLNGRVPLIHPKKVKGSVNPAGLAERAALLVAAGFTADLLERRLGPSSAHGMDDLLDAAACCVVAERVAGGVALRFPEGPPLRDGAGLEMAIWA